MSSDTSLTHDSPALATADTRGTGRLRAARSDDAGLRAWRALLHAHAALMRRLEADLMQQRGISMAEFDALMQLAAAPRRRLRMGELADQVLLSRSAVSRLVDRLEDSGLVVRERCSPDGRGAYAVLTGDGVRLLRGCLPAHLAGVRAYFLDAVDAVDLAVIARVMTDLAGRNGRPLPWDEARGRSVARSSPEAGSAT